jgi:hypothetical protein
MRNRRSVVAAFALLAVLAVPASADWSNPTDDCPVGGAPGCEELMLAVQLGFQIAQVAL